VNFILVSSEILCADQKSCRLLPALPCTVFKGNVRGTESKDASQQSDQTINAYDISPRPVDQEQGDKKKNDTMKDPFPSVPSSDVTFHHFSPLDSPG
jgi:hypothetical protein